jgi:hypothetical protein
MASWIVLVALAVMVCPPEVASLHTISVKAATGKGLWPGRHPGLQFVEIFSKIAGEYQRE